MHTIYDIKYHTIYYELYVLCYYLWIYMLYKNTHIIELTLAITNYNEISMYYIRIVPSVVKNSLLGLRVQQHEFDVIITKFITKFI